MTSIPRMSRMVKHLFEHDSVELARAAGLRQRNLTFVQLAFILVLDWWNDLKRVELGNLCCSDRIGLEPAASHWVSTQVVRRVFGGLEPRSSEDQPSFLPVDAMRKRTRGKGKQEGIQWQQSQPQPSDRS